LSHPAPAASPNFDWKTMSGWDDAQFVAESYRRLLGREADARGYAACTRLLRAGQHRSAVLAGLLASGEAARHLGPEACRRLRDRLAPSTGQRWSSRLRRRYRKLRPVPPPPIRHGLRPPSGGAPPLTSAPQPARTALGHEAARVVFTIAARNYLPQLRVLMASIARHQPDCLAVLVLVDGLADGTERLPGTGLGPVLVIGADELGVPTLGDMRLRYSILELCTALKPHAMRMLLEQGGRGRQVVYLDPDIELYAPLSAVFSALQAGASVAVTPHVLRPICGGQQPADHDILKSGVFNLGFIAMRDCAEALAFLHWWGAQLLNQCLVAFEQNLFTDQRWCDLLPCFVEHLAVLRDPGLNVAYWNLAQRTPPGESTPQPENTALTFFHFSGFDPRHPERCSRHLAGLDEDRLRPWLPLLRGYADRLLAAGWQALPGSGANLERLPNEQPLPELLRAHYRRLWPQPAQGPREALLHPLLADALTPESTTGLPRLLHTLHAREREVRETFDLNDAADRADFADWVRCCAQDSLQLTGLLLEPPSSKAPHTP
jgi:hypothetical protein